ncbi:MAG: NAD(P)H-hydrate dehydratase, partial [Candidatus Omnitrophica bacterium]|nr:NAD(P)H-hydrate dehydratase [Candidatus Omnitrophota bacterium]
PKSHKGDYGRIFILAGSEGLTGAAHLAGMGALRMGAGLVTVGVPLKVYPIIARREAEVMVRPFPSTREGTLADKGFGLLQKFLKSQNVLALGPGLSQNRDTQKLIRRLVARTSLPVVIDADGLNAFCGYLSSLKKSRGRAVLTPHPGEFVRLFSGDLTSEEAVRRKRAVEIASRFGAVLVLKGHRTVVAAPSGQVYVNATGNPGMATGGTGDILTGMIAALIGQHFSLFDAARFGVYIHGLAGDLAAREIGQISLTAGDILQFVPLAIQKSRGKTL